MAFKDLKPGDIIYTVYSDIDRDPMLGIEELVVSNVERYKYGKSIDYYEKSNKDCISSFFVPKDALTFSKTGRFYINYNDASVSLKLKCWAMKYRVEKIIKDNF